MGSPSTFLHTPQAEEVFALARRCHAVHSLGVITGGNGSGKTTTLRYLADHPGKCGIEGRVAYFLAATAAGPTRGLKDFLGDRGVRQAIHQKGLSMKLLARLAHRELQEHDIRLVVVDEADLLDLESLQGFVSMADTCRDMGYPIAVLFAGVRNPTKWINQIAAAESRTLHYHQLTSLTPALITAIFAAWGAPLENLAARVKDNDKEATAVLRSIAHGTGGNFRKIFYFASLAALEHSGEPITNAVADQIFHKMTRA
jgi:DNA transposition AAA+ family ATPase